jgi:lipopolysaccharide transport system permease protein
MLIVLDLEVEKILSALFRYRGLIFGLVARDFHARYLNSALGSIWSVINPLTQILIYTLIFSQVMRAKLPGIEDAMGYSIYLCAGLIPWQYFCEVVSRSITIFLEQATLLKKISFPRSTLPVYVFLSSSINFGILFILFLVFIVIIGKWPGWSILSVIPLLFLQLGLAVGLGVFLGTLNVFFRDVGQAMSIILQFWFWLTPIVYPIQAVPDRLQWLLAINPMFAVVKSYQDIFLYGYWPQWGDLFPLAMLSIIFLAVGYWTFVSLDKEMVDEL